MTQTNQLPPKILVQTWVALCKNSECQEARDRAMEMLIGAFGDMRSVMEYMENNHLA